MTHRQGRATEGRTPRFFTQHPAGHCLYALNEDSDSIVAIDIDTADGRLGRTRSTLRCGSPVCMIFSH